MKKQNDLLQAYLAQLAENCRAELHYTQEQMAEQLHITARAYNNIKHKRHTLSIHTFLFLLLAMPEDKTMQTLQELKALLLTINTEADDEL